MIHNRHEYYESLKELARSTRAKYGLTTPRVLRTDMRRIYKDQGIRIDLRAGFKNLRGAYFDDEHGTSVVMAKSLPLDPAVFTLAHELKHHLCDREDPEFQCRYEHSTSNPIEIGAEVFGAELIFPESDFESKLEGMGVARGSCNPEHLVQLKRFTKTTLSYQGLVKRAEFLGFVDAGEFSGVKFKKLEEQLYGRPFRRHRRSARSPL